MSLPEELDREFWQEVIQLEGEKRMPYITSVERFGIQKGIEQGIEQGIQQSRQQMKQILLESIELGLELKFGETGLSLLPSMSYKLFPSECPYELNQALDFNFFPGAESELLD